MNTRTHFIAVVLLALAVAVGSLGITSTIRSRPATGAGVWYPSDAEQLRAAVEQYISAATSERRQGRIAAIVTPHSGYPFAGSVMAEAFKHLDAGQYDRVILLGASHHASFAGASIPRVHYYETPLGNVLLDGQAVTRICWSPLISQRAVVYRTPDVMDALSNRTQRISVHEYEHSIEVLLPFLQAQLGEFRLVPILVGNLTDHRGRLNEHSLEAIANALRPYFTDRTLLVVSAELTHHGPSYGYTLAGENIEERIRGLDYEALHHILRRDFRGFEQYLRETRNTVCGRGALGVMMKLLPRHVTGDVIDYRMSAEVSGDWSHSVSYAAVVFYDEGAPLPSRESIRLERPQLEEPAPTPPEEE